MFTFQFDDAREREKHARRVSHRFACKKFTVAYGEILVFVSDTYLINNMLRTAETRII